MRFSGVVMRNTQVVARYDNVAVRRDKCSSYVQASLSKKRYWVRLLPDSYLLAQTQLI